MNNFLYWFMSSTFDVHRQGELQHVLYSQQYLDKVALHLS